jgi:hypothetical protein
LLQIEVQFFGVDIEELLSAITKEVPTRINNAKKEKRNIDVFFIIC